MTTVARTVGQSFGLSDAAQTVCDRMNDVWWDSSKNNQQKIETIKARLSMVPDEVRREVEGNLQKILKKLEAEGKI
ncbi:unnamed protein product, partial [Mesorhabditis spiculigera]